MDPKKPEGEMIGCRMWNKNGVVEMKDIDEVGIELVSLDANDHHLV